MGFLDSIKNSKFVQGIKRLLKSIHPPFLNGLSLWDLLNMYAEGIKELQIGNRAAAISWRLLISLFPFILFFLMLIEHLPYYDVIQEYLYSEIMAKILPPNIIDGTKQYIMERQNTIKERYDGDNFFTIFIGIIVFLVASTQGMNSLIKGLNFNDPDLETDRKRSGLKQYSTAILLTFSISILMIMGMLTIYYVDVIGAINARQNPEFHISQITLEWIKYLLFAIIFFTAVCMIYYYGPITKLRGREIVPGALLTTILFLIGVYLFGVFISNFNQYNLLYGSLGTILIIMLLLNIIVILIILGYQLNLSIKDAKEINE